MPRPLGSPNRARRDVRLLLDRLERREHVNFGEVFRRLYAIAIDSDPENAAAAISAARTLFAYRYGLPRQDVTLTHAVEGAEVILLRLVQSEQHRKAVAAVERHRALLASSTTVNAEPEGTPS